MKKVMESSLMVLFICLTISCSRNSNLPASWGRIPQLPQGACDDISGTYLNRGLTSEYARSDVFITWFIFDEEQKSDALKKVFVTVKQEPPARLSVEAFAMSGSQRKIIARRDVPYQCLNGGIVTSYSRGSGDSRGPDVMLGKEKGSLTFRKNEEGHLIAFLDGRWTGCLCLCAGFGGILPWTTSKKNWLFFTEYRPE